MGSWFSWGGSSLCKAQSQDNCLLMDVHAGKRKGCKVWAVTGNTVWSTVWNKGMSSMKHLFKLVVTLNMECLTHEVWL